MNALIVDDNEVNLLFAAEVMREHGWNVTEATGGYAAMMHLDTGKFDLILADIRMPHLSGDALLHWLRSDDRFRNTRVVACTAQAQPAEVAALRDAGFDLILLKPVSSEELMAAVNACVPNAPLAKAAVIA